MMFDWSVGVKGVLLILVIAAVAFCITGLIVAMVSFRRRSSSQPVATVVPDAPVPSSEERQAILKRLAQGEITKDQAEEQLGALGMPVPADMAVPEPRPGGGRGCLIAVLVCAVLIPLALLLLWFCHYFGCPVRF